MSAPASKVDVLAVMSAVENKFTCSDFWDVSLTQMQEARAAVAELVEAATRANGHHTAPHDCYATGPLTGNPVRDLVECPGCVLAQVLARFGGA